MLPTWLEPLRESLEKVLPKIELSKNKDSLRISD
jgi:hypothetical protein